MQDPFEALPCLITTSCIDLKDPYITLIFATIEKFEDCREARIRSRCFDPNLVSKDPMMAQVTNLIWFVQVISAMVQRQFE